MVDGAAIVALGLMYAIEVPRGGPYVFGTTNDLLGVVGQVLVMPVMAEVAAELPERRARDTLLGAGLVGCAVGAASGALLVARVLPFAPSTVISLAAMEVQAAWMLVAGARLQRTRAFPGGLARLGRAIGGGMLVGGAIAGSGLLIPRDSRVRRAVVGAGVAPGAAAWLAWPIWLHLVGRHLTSTPRPS